MATTPKKRPTATIVARRPMNKRPAAKAAAPTKAKAEKPTAKKAAPQKTEAKKPAAVPKAETKAAKPAPKASPKKPAPPKPAAKAKAKPAGKASATAKPAAKAKTTIAKATTKSAAPKTATAKATTTIAKATTKSAAPKTATAKATTPSPKAKPAATPQGDHFVGRDVSQPKYPVVHPGDRQREKSMKADKPANAPTRQRFTDEELDELKRRFLDERAKIRSQLRTTRSEALSSTEGENVEEDGSNNFTRASDLNRANSQNETLKAIDNALHAIKEKTYGICSVCGKRIPRERLRAFPFAIRCVTCKDQYEKDVRRDLRARGQ